MKRIAHPFTLSAGALATALILSACGGGESTDKTPPTVTITDNVADTTATGPVTFTFTFSEEVKDFTADDVVVSGGDKASSVTKSSATVYSLVVTPFANKTDTISVSIPANKFTDLANNANAAVAAVTQAYNTTPPQEPSAAAPTPTLAAANVISLYSNAYTNKTVNTWRTDWSAATLADVKIAGDDVKKYSALDFVGIEATGANAIDATGMTHINFNIWTANATTVRLKLVDWGADGAYGGGDDSEHEVAGSPEIGKWNTVKIPLTDFTGLKARNHLSQFIISALPTGSATVFIDNIYFSKESVTPAAEPSAAAPTPTLAAANVISLYSNAYTNKTVNTWRTDWSAATLADVKIAGDDVKKYSALDFVGIEATGANAIDATGMTYINFDVWTANATTVRLKLVDWGADGAYGGGDDSEHEVAGSPEIGKWNTVKIPLTDFTGLKARNHLSQFIISALPTGSATVFIDNIYFSK